MPTPLQSTPEGRPRLLVVDDDALIADTLSFALGAEFEVLACESRLHAIELLRQLPEAPQLALVDLGLPPTPHAPDEGFQLITDLLAHSPKMRIFVLSGQNDAAHARHARALGAAEFISKPCDPAALKKILDERNILLVDDEIQMGFYRAGKFWAMENFNVEPDIIVFGKALTNGLNPLSGLWAREELISPEVFPPGSTHSTFSSNPLGTAVGLEAVRMMQEENYEEITQRKGAYFLAQIRELQRRYPKVIGNTDGMGMALRIELCQEDGFEPDRELTDKIFAEGMKGDLDARGRRTGLVLDIGGYYKNVFTLAPCFDMSEEEIDISVELLEQLIRRCAPDRV